MGAEWVGELTWLCGMFVLTGRLSPTLAQLHLRTFGSPERVAIAKSELVEALAPMACSLNYDDPQVRAIESESGPCMYYGLDERAEVRASDLQGDALAGFSRSIITTCICSEQYRKRG